MRCDVYGVQEILNPSSKIDVTAFSTSKSQRNGKSIAGTPCLDLHSLIALKTPLCLYKKNTASQILYLGD